MDAARIARLIAERFLYLPLSLANALVVLSFACKHVTDGHDSHIPKMKIPARKTFGKGTSSTRADLALERNAASAAEVSL